MSGIKASVNTGLKKLCIRYVKLTRFTTLGTTSKVAEEGGKTCKYVNAIDNVFHQHSQCCSVCS
jgi:hypothetical protein